jgi:hypothetical protein
VSSSSPDVFPSEATRETAASPNRPTDSIHVDVRFSHAAFPGRAFCLGNKVWASNEAVTVTVAASLDLGFGFLAREIEGSWMSNDGDAQSLCQQANGPLHLSVL